MSVSISLTPKQKQTFNGVMKTAKLKVPGTGSFIEITAVNYPKVMSALHDARFKANMSDGDDTTLLFLLDRVEKLAHFFDKPQPEPSQAEEILIDES